MGLLIAELEESEWLECFQLDLRHCSRPAQKCIGADGWACLAILLLFNIEQLKNC